MNILNRLSLIQGIWALIIASLLSLVAMGVFLANQTATLVHDEHVEQLEALTETAHSLLASYQQQEGLIGRETAQQRALEALSNLRYNGSNYFWLHDEQLNVLMHPTKPQNVGRNMTQVKDGAGNYHWQAMQQVINRQLAGTVEYLFISSTGEQHAKLSHVRLFAPWGWVVGTGFHIDDVQAAYTSGLKRLMIFAAVTMTVLLPLVALFLRRIQQRFNHLRAQLHALAEDDLRLRHSLQGDDELSRFSRDISQSIASQASNARQSIQVGQQLHSVADEVLSMTSESRQRVNSQFEQLEQLSAAMNESTVAVQQVAANAEQIAEIGSRSQSSAEQGQQSLSRTSRMMQQLAQQVESSCAAVDTLQQDVSAIGTVVEVINDISDQTNLLALNAAIEAARAGEQGRGFAVVADEVRQLARRTQESTKEIQTTIQQLQTNASQVGQLMAQGQTQAVDSVDSVSHADQQLGVIVSQMRELSDMLHQVATATEQQTSVSEEMNANLISIRDSAEGSTTSFRLLDEKAQQLAAAGEQLQQQMARYRLDDSENAPVSGQSDETSAAIAALPLSAS